MAPDWMYSDPVPARVKGWSPKPGRGVRLRKQWAEPETLGSGAAEPPIRDDWKSDPGFSAAPAVAEPPSTPYTQDAAESVPPPAAPIPGSPPKPSAASARTPATTTDSGGLEPGGAAAPSAPEGGAGPSKEPVVYRPPAGEDLTPNQFGDKSLSPAEAYAACGPAAAVAFARANGRNPTLREATTLASQRQLWDTGGMHGPAAEVQLMRLMGVNAAIGSDHEDNIQQALSRGDPVSISTPNHYFVADQYNPQNGTYHVGNSGTAFRVGSPWMTMQQIRALGGGVNGVIYADHPTGDPTPYPDTHPLGQDRAQPIPSTPQEATPAMPTRPHTAPRTALAPRTGRAAPQSTVKPSGAPGQTAASTGQPAGIPKYGITDQMVEQYADQHQVSWDEARQQLYAEADKVLGSGAVGAGADVIRDNWESDAPAAPTIHDDQPWSIPVPADAGGSFDFGTQQPPIKPPAPAVAPPQQPIKLSDEAPWHIPVPPKEGESGVGGFFSGLGSAVHDAGDSIRQGADAFFQPAEPTSTPRHDPNAPGQLPPEVDVSGALQQVGQDASNAITNAGQNMRTASDAAFGPTATGTPTVSSLPRHDPNAPGQLPPDASEVVTAAGTALPIVDLPPPTPGSPLEKSLDPAAPAMSGQERLASGTQAGLGYEAAREQATENLNPLRDVPVLGGVINQATDPLAWFPLGKAAKAGSEIATGVGETVLKEAAPGVEAVVAGAAEKTAPAAAEHLWDPVATAYNEAWNTLLPSTVTEKLPAQASAKFAAQVGGGAAAGAAIMAHETDPNDPNYWAKIGAAGLTGVVGALVAPKAFGELAKTLEPTLALANKRVAESVATRGNQIQGAGTYGQLWQDRIIEVLGKPGKGDNTLEWQMYVEENGHAPPGSSPAAQKLADDMLHYTQQTGDEGRRLGYIGGDVTQNVQFGPGMSNRSVKGYLPRKLEPKPNEPPTQSTWSGNLNPRDDYSHMREHTFLRDGVMSGTTYDNSVSGAFGQYAEHVTASRANAMFLEDLKHVAPETIERLGTNGEHSDGWIPGSQYKVKQWQSVAFAPELKTVLDNITSPDRTKGALMIGGALSLSSELKKALFSPSLFHMANEMRQIFNATGAEGLKTVFPKSVFHAVNPGARRKFWTSPDTIQAAKDAMDAGLTLMRTMPDAPQTALSAVQGAGIRAGWGGVSGGLAGGFTAHQDPTQSDKDILARSIEGALVGAAGGVAGGFMTKMLWEGAMPVMKLQSYEIMKRSLGPQAAAKYINSVYGGQNLEAMARSKTFQSVLRGIVLAPDWQESWFRQIGSAMMPGAGGIRNSIPGMGLPTGVEEANRQYWLRAAASSAFMLEGFNLAFNQHGTQDNGKDKELLLETTGLYDLFGWDRSTGAGGEKYRTYVDILGPYRGLINAPGDPLKFAGARAGLLPSDVNTLATGKDWRGKDLSPAGEDPLKSAGIRVGYMLSRMAPVGPSEFMRTSGTKTGEPGAIVAAQALVGLRETRQSPLQVNVQARNDAWTKAGFSQEQEQQFTASYLGQIRVAEAKTTEVFTRGAASPSATHQAIMTEAQRVNWPNRPDALKAWEPADMAADPIKNAEFITFMQTQGPISTQSSEHPADIKPEDLAGTTVDGIKALYWNPPGKGVDEMASLSPEGQSRVREAVIAEQAIAAGVDPNSLRDAIKASEQGTTLQPLPGISSATLDQWSQQYRAVTDTDPVLQGEARRKLVDDLAAEHNVTPAAVYQRIKMRGLPIRKEDPTEPGIPPAEVKRRELQTSYERAQDALFSSRDPATYPKYAGPDGKPYKGSGPQQWTDFDKQIAADTKAGRKTHTPEVQALLTAREAGAAVRLKSLYNKPEGTDFERWYGVGRNMDEKQWKEYTTGTGKQFTDINDPTENRKRTRTIELWKASTPQERQRTQVTLTIIVNGRPQVETTTLDQAKKHIEMFKDPKWKVDWGLDSAAPVPVQSGAQP